MSLFSVAAVVAYIMIIFFGEKTRSTFFVRMILAGLAAVSMLFDDTRTWMTFVGFGLWTGIAIMDTLTYLYYDQIKEKINGH